MGKITSINPSNRKVIGKVEITSEKEINQKIKDAGEAKLEWKDLGVKGRVKILKNVVSNLLKHKTELAKTASSEMGMPISLSVSDVDDAVSTFSWYLDNAEKYLSPEVVYEDKKTKNTVYREPLGVGVHITPWNFPASNFVWSVGQSLVSGNAIVYKASEEVVLSAKLIEKIVNASGLPKGVFSEVYGFAKEGALLVNDDVDLICFTGSTKVGKELYKIAAKKFIKVFLELGGSAPGIVFEDANLDRVLESIFSNRFYYSGQVCDGLKRLIVDEKILDLVFDKLSQRIKSAKVGDALDKTTEIGPLVSEKQLQSLERQVEDATKKGAKVVIGGKRFVGLNGFFYEPTLLTNIKNNMNIWNEEVFGPVLPVVSFNTEDEAVRLANDTKYGLGSYIFTEDKEKALRVASQLETGMVAINNSSYVKPTSPFGGYKQSGIGREHGQYGFNELTQLKVISEEK